MRRQNNILFKITSLFVNALLVLIVFTMPVQVDAMDVVIPINDFHTQIQYEYLKDSDVLNIHQYVNGTSENSIPRPIVFDFSEDVGEASHYVFQASDQKDFSTIKYQYAGLNEPRVSIYNLELGEHLYYRGGKRLDMIEDSRVHEFTVADICPRNIRIEGMSNFRDIGGYDSSLAPGAKIAQGLYYRGANPNSITENGKAEMLRLGIRQEIDMREQNLCQGPYVDGVNYNPCGRENPRS